MPEEKKCDVCSATFLASSKDIKRCSLKCDREVSDNRSCRICKKPFRPKSWHQVMCGKPACIKENDRLKKTAGARREEERSLKAAKTRDHSPFKACVSCANWKKEPPGVTDMGGQCLPGFFRACKPWDGAFHYKEKA